LFIFLILIFLSSILFPLLASKICSNTYLESDIPLFSNIFNAAFSLSFLGLYSLLVLFSTTTAIS